MTGSSDEQLAAIAAKSIKETQYHVHHSHEWLVRFGDGTDESHARMQSALDDLWPYTGELFAGDGVDAQLAEAGTAPDPSTLHDEWLANVDAVIAEATLTLPSAALVPAVSESWLAPSETVRPGSRVIG